MDPEPTAPLIAIVDDDEGLRDALDSLMRSVGYRTFLFDSTESAIASTMLPQAACLIIDYRAPGSEGLQLQHTLERVDRSMPVVLVSAQANEIRVPAREASAPAVLATPFSVGELLATVHAAVQS